MVSKRDFFDSGDRRRYSGDRGEEVWSWINMDESPGCGAGSRSWRRPKMTIHLLFCGLVAAAVAGTFIAFWPDPTPRERCYAILRGSGVRAHAKAIRSPYLLRFVARYEGPPPAGEKFAGEGVNGLHLAAKLDDAGLFRALLYADADITSCGVVTWSAGAERQSGDLGTPLDVAVTAPACRVLQDALGRLPLMRDHSEMVRAAFFKAVAEGRCDACRIFLETGSVDPDWRDEEERTALATAERNGHAEVAELLSDHAGGRQRRLSRTRSAATPAEFTEQ